MNTRKAKNIRIKNNKLRDEEQSRKNWSFRLCMSLGLCMVLILTGCTESRGTDPAYRAYMAKLDDYIDKAPISDDVAAEAFAGAKANQIVVMKAGAEITEELTITGYFKRIGEVTYENYLLLAKQFVDAHPHVKVIFDDYEDDDAYSEVFSILLMTGNYGDVVLLPYYTKPAYLQESKFVNLMSYIEDETKFKKEDYFVNLIYAERNVDGALLAFPTYFFAESQYTFLTPLSEKISDRFENDPSFTMRDLIEFYLEKKAENGPDWNMSLYESFHPIKLITLNFDSLVDLKNKKAHFTDPDFMELMEKVKRDVRITHFHYTEDGLQNEVFWSGDQKTISELGDAQSTKMLEEFTFEHYALLPTTTRVRSRANVIPNFSGKYPFTAFGRLAISRKSKNPDLAWEFIQYLASEKEIPPYDPTSLSSGAERFDLYGDLLNYYPSVNKANYRKLMEVSLDYDDRYNRRVLAPQLTCSWEEYRAMVMEFFPAAAEKLNYSTIWSGDYFQPYARGIIWDEMYLYLSDLQSVEQTMANIENKIQIMLNE